MRAWTCGRKIYRVRTLGLQSVCAQELPASNKDGQSVSIGTGDGLRRSAAILAASLVCRQDAGATIRRCPTGPIDREALIALGDFLSAAAKLPPWSRGRQRVGTQEAALEWKNRPYTRAETRRRERSRCTARCVLPSALCARAHALRLNSSSALPSDRRQQSVPSSSDEAGRTMIPCLRDLFDLMTFNSASDDLS